MNESKLAKPDASTSYSTRPGVAEILGTCWANGPSNANPPSKVTVGDCTVEALYHLRALRQGAAGVTPYMPAADQVLATYSAWTGYVLGDPDTDQGADDVSILNNLQTRGLSDGSKILAWMAIDGSSILQLQSFNQEFCGLDLCIEVPDALMNAVPQSAGPGWSSTPVATWGKGTPNPNSGHCIPGVDHTPKGIIVDSWGMPILFTYDGIGELAVPAAGGAVYVAFDLGMLAAAIQKAPDGLDYRSLVVDWDAEGGKVPLPADGQPPPKSLIEQLEAVLGRLL